jgi:colicin import membrane protein
MSLNPGIRARIFSACDELYNAAGKIKFPTVDVVRRLAKVSMNDCCVGVKEWRSLQTPTPNTTRNSVAERVQQACEAATAQLWTAAMDIAQESLDAAKELMRQSK